MQIFAGIQGSYKSFEIALFQGENLLDVRVQDRESASSNFLLFFQAMLNDNKVSFEDLSFLAVDQGPGAFTSLRVLISTVNGLTFDTNLKLVGVDGLDALAQETFMSLDRAHLGEQPVVLLSLLNAYNNEVYYGVHAVREDGLKGLMPKGYKKIDLLLDELLLQYKHHKFVITGNAVQFYQSVIEAKLGDLLIEPFGLLSVCSAKQVGLMGLDQWKRGVNVCSELFPLYLKSQTFAVRK